MDVLSTAHLLRLKHNEECHVVPVENFDAAIEVYWKRLFQLEFLGVVKYCAAVLLLLARASFVHAFVALHLHVRFEEVVVNILIHLLFLIGGRGGVELGVERSGVQWQ